MSRRGITIGLFCLMLGLGLSVGMMAFGEAETLAAESEAYCQSTARDTPTKPDEIIAKVNKAVALLEQEGPDAFLKFQGKDSEFIFDGTYMWIHKLSDCTMLMHPIKYKMVGKQYAGLKDRTGKLFFVVMSEQCNKEGSGWVEYRWPKPGTKDFVRKISYVKKCTMSDGTEVVIGCGLYNYNEDDLKALTIH